MTIRPQPAKCKHKLQLHFYGVTKKHTAISSARWTITIIHTMQQNLPCSHFYLKKA